MTVATLPMPSPSSVSFQIPEVDRIPCPPNLDYTQQTHQKNSRPRSRDRGVILTLQGWQKLMQAGVLCDRYGNRYTFEILAGQSALSPRTVSKILNSSSPVDKRTLTIFFDAFHLSLESDDYALHNTVVTEQTTDSIRQHQAPDQYATEFQLLVKEVIRLKERLEDYSQRFELLGLAESGQKV